MEDFKYEGTIFTDSMELYEHIIAFKNAEDNYGDGEFAIKINYNPLGEIKLIDF